MKRIKRNHFFDAATDNSGTGTSKKPEDTEKKEPEDKTVVQKKDDEQKKQAEDEKLKLELEAEKKAREELEAKLKEKELETLSEEEKKKVQDESDRKQLLKDHEDLQLERLGLDESYRDLIKGETPADIKKKAEAIAKVIANTKTNTEAEVKKAVSKTLIPGGAGDSDNDGEMDSVDYFTDVLGGKI